MCCDPRSEPVSRFADLRERRDAKVVVCQSRSKCIARADRINYRGLQSWMFKRLSPSDQQASPRAARDAHHLQIVISGQPPRALLKGLAVAGKHLYHPRQFLIVDFHHSRQSQRFDQHFRREEVLTKVYVEDAERAGAGGSQKLVERAA